VNDFHEDDAEVSISLHNLQKKYEGVDGLARHLDSNTKVSLRFVSTAANNLSLYRPVSKEARATFKSALKSNYNNSS